MITKALILAFSLTNIVIGDKIGYREITAISALEEDMKRGNVRRQSNQLLSSPSHSFPHQFSISKNENTIDHNDSALSTSIKYKVRRTSTSRNNGNTHTNKQSRIITEIQITRDEFVLQCREYLTSDTIIMDNLISQDDIASFLSTLSKNLGRCESDCDVSFHNLPSDLQLTFIWTVCPRGSGFQECLDEIDLKDEQGESFGLDVEKSTRQELEDHLHDFCYLIYPFSVDYHGGTEVPTYGPSSQPITFPSVSPSKFASTTPTADTPSTRPTDQPSIYPSTYKSLTPTSKIASLSKTQRNSQTQAPSSTPTSQLNINTSLVQSGFFRVAAIGTTGTAVLVLFVYFFYRKERKKDDSYNFVNA